jgi:hypothetical protein
MHRSLKPINIRLKGIKAKLNLVCVVTVIHTQRMEAVAVIPVMGAVEVIPVTDIFGVMDGTARVIVHLTTSALPRVSNSGVKRAIMVTIGRPF